MCPKHNERNNLKKNNKTNNNCLKSKTSVHGNKIELNHLAIFQICFLQENLYNNII